MPLTIKDIQHFMTLLSEESKCVELLGQAGADMNGIDICNCTL